MDATADEIHIRQLDETDVDLAAQVLTVAFMDNPFFVSVIPNATDRRAQLPIYFAAGVRYAIRFGKLWGAGRTAEHLDGVGWGYAVPEGVSNEDRDIEVGFAEVELLLGDGYQRIRDFAGYVDHRVEPLLPEPRFDLVLIGIRPEVQGSGMGAALLGVCVDWAAGEGLTVALWTDTKSALRFYQRHDFVLIDQDTYGEDEVEWWALHRPRG